MSYDLHPNNRKLGTFRMGMLSWPWMLDQGVGLIIGYGPGIRPGHYVSGSREGAEPGDNNGFPVSGNEARMMARAAHHLAEISKANVREWGVMSEEERQRWGVECAPVGPETIAKVELFAKWAWKSKGFKIR
jgi:hypothetical protein